MIFVPRAAPLLPALDPAALKEPAVPKMNVIDLVRRYTNHDL
ncbi:hypothetical protein [Streptomyces melanogenes]